jgi:hypothetical protein
MSTAAQLDGQSLSTMSATAHRRLRALLLETNANISYETRELRALLERQHRSPGISASALLNSPVGANALRTLRLLQDDALAPFRGRDFDAARMQAEIEVNFSAVRCKSGKSNRACAQDSRSSPSAETAHMPTREGST